MKSNSSNDRKNHNYTGLMTFSHNPKYLTNNNKLNIQTSFPLFFLLLCLSFLIFHSSILSYSCSTLTISYLRSSTRLDILSRYVIFIDTTSLQLLIQQDLKLQTSLLLELPRSWHSPSPVQCYWRRILFQHQPTEPGLVTTNI